MNWLQRQFHSLIWFAERLRLWTLADGNAVAIGQTVKITPRFSLGGVREVFKEFGNPASGRVKKNFPQRVVLTVSALKRAKEAVPNAKSKAAAPLKADAEKQAKARAKRKKQREREEKEAA